jgi:CheY-like chemotaxis protein
VIACGEGLYGIPSRHVLEVARRREYPEEPVAGGAVLRHRDGALPFRSLAETIIRQRVDEPLVVVLGVGSSRVAFSVPAVLGEHDLVRQPVDELLGALAYINASATLDDGRLVLLLTMPGLLRHAERSAGGPLGEPRRIERPTRVLVVDDSEIVRDLVAQVLRGGGMEVETAPEGRTALERLAAALPDVVVADIEMPVMDGFELLRRIRAQWRALPVVLLTSKASPEDRRRAVELEASAHLIKSGFEEATLVETVQRLGRRR